MCLFSLYPDPHQYLQESVEKVLLEYLPSLKQQYTHRMSASLVVLYHSDKDVLITVRIFDRGLVSCNIEYYKEETDPPLLTYEVSLMTRFSVLQICSV